MKGKDNMPNRNPHAAALASSLFHKRVVCAKKGKGSYKRKQEKAKNDE
jgi:stalled ribosome alternative rescue factor ArfA